MINPEQQRDWHGRVLAIHGRNTRNCRTYRSWAQMNQRCRNPKNDRWKDYGGRGITICDQWLDFMNFLVDMGERPEGMQLDRKNNDLGYSPENCRWATRRQQQNNRRDNSIIEFNGERRSATEWSRILGFARGVIQYRLKSGWSAQDIVSTPCQIKSKGQSK